MTTLVTMAWTMECPKCGARAIAHIKLHAAICSPCGRRMKTTETTKQEAAKWLKRGGKRG